MDGPEVTPVILDRFRIDGKVAVVTGAGRGIDTPNLDLGLEDL